MIYFGHAVPLDHLLVFFLFFFLYNLLADINVLNSASRYFVLVGVCLIFVIFLRLLKIPKRLLLFITNCRFVIIKYLVLIQ